MMLKQFGTFTILAVCLFAIVIVMGGCTPDDKPGTEIVNPPVETPMGKLAGTYRLIPSIDNLASGELYLGAGGTGWSMHLTWDNGWEPSTVAGPTWSATDDTLTMVFSTGESDTDDYTLVGKELKIFHQGRHSASNVDEWQKE